MGWFAIIFLAIVAIVLYKKGSSKTNDFDKEQAKWIKEAERRNRRKEKKLNEVRNKYKGYIVELENSLSEKLDPSNSRIKLYLKKKHLSSGEEILIVPSYGSKSLNHADLGFVYREFTNTSADHEYFLWNRYGGQDRQSLTNGMGITLPHESLFVIGMKVETEGKEALVGFEYSKPKSIMVRWLMLPQNASPEEPFFEIFSEEEKEMKIQKRKEKSEKEKLQKLVQEEKERIQKEIEEKERQRRIKDLALKQLMEEGVNVPLSPQRREPIAQELQDAVWNRDGGKCVKCGSQENLEFDHIIPHSKGGANTYRNLQLLCQDCNRSKSNKIG